MNFLNTNVRVCFSKSFVKPTNLNPKNLSSWYNFKFNILFQDRASCGRATCSSQDGVGFSSLSLQFLWCRLHHWNKGVCHTVALPFTLIKKYLKAKEEELWKLKYFTMQKYNLQKILLKKPKSFKILITL